MNAEQLLMVLRAPVVSAKTTTILSENNQVVFKVLKSATKPQIKQAVEDVFKVKVKSVTVVNVKGKAKRFKLKEGRRSDWKKAYVSLLDGYQIDFSNIE